MLSLCVCVRLFLFSDGLVLEMEVEGAYKEGDRRGIFTEPSDSIHRRFRFNLLIYKWSLLSPSPSPSLSYTSR